MGIRYVLSDYLNAAMSDAAFDKLEDGTFAGRIPSCHGVAAFGISLKECEAELRSGLRLKHPLPVLSGIDLNREPAREPVDTV